MKTACPYHTAEVHEWDGAHGFVAEVRARARLVDLLAIVAVPVILVALHGLDPAARRTLAFRYADPTLHTAYASNFVHLDRGHLLGNLGAYLLLVPTAYLLSVLSNRRRHFLIVSVAILGVCPFVISLSQLPFRDTGLGLGFSGLVLSWYGYGSLVFVGYLATRLTTGLHLDHAPLVFAGQIAVIALLVPAGRTDRLAGVGGAIVFGIAYLAVRRRPFVGGSGALFDADAHRAGYLEVAALAVVLGGAVLLVGFSGGRVGGARISLTAHFAGFASGFLLSYVVLRTDCALSHVYHCAGPDGDCRLHNSPLTRGLRRVLLTRWLR